VGDLGNTSADMTGRATEAVGDVTDDDGLKREGKVDRAGASVKDKVDDVKDKVGDMLNRDK
jgi:uncharacterized protein YjbJ (UPF0337 family)